MLGVLRSRVNEDDTPMDAGKGKSRDFGLSQALANQVVRKAVCGDFILCGLSPPVSPRRKMVRRVATFSQGAINMRLVFQL
jgi:hypothetical protein